MEAYPRPSGGDQNRVSTILAVYWTLYPILVILIAARIFVRVKIQYLGLDDYFMLLAWVTLSVNNSLTSYYKIRGGARHLFYLNPDQITLVLKYSFISEPFFFLSAVLGKSSVALLLLRIIGPVTTWRRRFLYGNFILYWVITIVAIVTGFLRCSPTSSIWEPVPVSICWNADVAVDLSILQGAHGTFIDFVLALLPVTIIRGLQIDLKRKIGLCILLGLGSLYEAVFTLLETNAYPEIQRAGIASLVKTISLQSLRAQADFTWAGYSLDIWGPIECFLVIICGCIPTVKPLFDFLVHGTPMRPLRTCPNKPNGYQMHSSNEYPAMRDIAQRFKDSAQDPGDRGLDSNSSPEAGRSMGMHYMQVEA